MKEIRIKGANENNLDNLDVVLPREKMIVFTGLSGSGKSSLAFDTIYAEGQRRYVESLSAYARQFLGQMEKPDVEFIEGLSPAISIDQKTTNNNPRSTVGTVTEIHDYLRLMFARIGKPHCHICGEPISSQSVDQIVDNIMKMEEGTKIAIIAPVIRARKGEHEKVIERIIKEGFTRARIDGKIINIAEEEIHLEKTFKHTIEIVVDRIIIREGQESRIAESVEIAIAHGDGLVIVKNLDEPDGALQQTTGESSDSKDESIDNQSKVNDEETGNGASSETVYNTKLACHIHGVGLEELEPRMFSFNSPFGACETCKGLGFTQYIDEDLLINKDKSIFGGALSNLISSLEVSGFYRTTLQALVDKHGIDVTAPFGTLPKTFRNEVLYGTKGKKLQYVYTSKNTGSVSNMNYAFEGLINSVERRLRESESEYLKEKMSKFLSIVHCPDCDGKRLKPEILAVTVGNSNIAEISELAIRDAFEFINNLSMDSKDEEISKQIVKEIKERLHFLIDVGLDYLSLSRSSGTLSGGESQRIRLATQIGSALTGVLYILDEPSIGLHQKDNEKLLATLRYLTDIGNTLIVVEHDEDTMRVADHIVDIGPGAGINGGRLVAEGDINEIINCEESITGQYLSGKRYIPVPSSRRKGTNESIKVVGASANNLKGIDVEFPLGKLVCVTGVSGSGKSSLVNDILFKGIQESLNGSKVGVGKHKKITGIEYIDKVIDIDQSPIGRTPRSNPATYTGMFTPIRDLFASLPEAKLRGYEKGRFSFNVKGGRCEACSGDGILKIEMHFLPDVYVGCEVCKGKRYSRETLEVKYKGKNISDVLEMSVEEARHFFVNIPSIAKKLETLDDVGLDYIKLGQPSTQLSGGEAQRVKLATELSKKSTGNTLYILDEPTTGLHFYDVDKLLSVLDTLVDAGNSVVVIEHNLDVIKRADHIIDLGPNGGDKGGDIVVTGTPEQVAECSDSYTGQFLKKVL